MEKRAFKFKIGDKVKYQLVDGSVMFTGEIRLLVINPTMKPYVILTENNVLKYANEEYLTLIEVETYKGYTIETSPNGTGHISTVYLNGVFKAGTASDLVKNGKSSIEKAKIKIDSLIAGTYNPIPGI